MDTWASHLLALVNNPAMSIGVQVFVQVPAFSSFRCIPRSGFPGTFGKSMFLSGCTILYFHPQCSRVPISPHHHQHVFSFCRNYSHPRMCEMVSHFDWHSDD